MTVSVWSCETFPFSLQQFLPILDLLSTISKKASYVKQFFEKSLSSLTSFPLSATIPIYLAIKLNVTFKEISFSPPDSSLFYIQFRESAISANATAKLSSDYYVCEFTESDEDLADAEHKFLFLSEDDSYASESMSNSAEEGPQAIPESLISRTFNKSKNVLFNELKRSR